MSDVNLFKPGTQLPVDESSAKNFAQKQQENQQAVMNSRDLTTENYKKYKNSMPSCNYLFKDGTVAVFLAGEYLTNNPLRQEELDKEVKNGHPHIRIDPNDCTVKPEDLNPETALRNKYFAEFQAEVEAKKNRDMGTSQQSKNLNVSTSKDMAAITANGAGALGSVPQSVLNALTNQSGSAPSQ